jgi:hypothetical protein
MLDAGPLVLLLGGTLRPDKVGTGRRFGKYNKPMYDRLLAEVDGALRSGPIKMLEAPGSA